MNDDDTGARHKLPEPMSDAELFAHLVGQMLAPIHVQLARIEEKVNTLTERLETLERAAE